LLSFAPFRKEQPIVPIVEPDAQHGQFQQEQRQSRQAQLTRGAGRLSEPRTTTPNGSPAQAGDTVIEVRDVLFAVSGRSIFDGLNITARKGRITAIMGPSGTGKTTLLKLITGQIYAQRGEVKVFGEDIAKMSTKELFAVRRRMGMLFQNGALLTDLDVYENVAFPLRAHTKLPESLVRHLVLTKLHAVGLRGASRLMPAELSGGMSRRVALARAIVMDPDLLIYDEPFVGLDPISMGVICRLIKQMNEALGITSIVVSHDVQELATIAHDSFLLSSGKVVASGTPDELKRSEIPEVRQFMGGLADGPVPFHYPAADYGADLLEASE
jgi:phospholipid/cholesterol/gamma-HCH transport system ATP-binding protein